MFERLPAPLHPVRLPDGRHVVEFSDHRKPQMNTPHLRLVIIDPADHVETKGRALEQDLFGKFTIHSPDEQRVGTGGLGIDVATDTDRSTMVKTRFTLGR